MNIKSRTRCSRVRLALLHKADAVCFYFGLTHDDDKGDEKNDCNGVDDSHFDAVFRSFPFSKLFFCFLDLFLFGPLLLFLGYPVEAVFCHFQAIFVCAQSVEFIGSFGQHFNIPIFSCLLNQIQIVLFQLDGFNGLIIV